MSEAENLHPCGISWAKWNWPPLQTPQDQKVVARYLKQQEKKEEQSRINQLEEALF